MGSCWYLEHVTTRDRIVLSRGENLIGRHSSCKIIINQPYDYVSRVHVKMTVNDAGVLVQSMNTSNGVFINEQKMKDQTTSKQVVEGTIISLGVEGHITNAPRNYPIFVLRKVVTEEEDLIELSSDDDDDTMPMQYSIPELASIKKDITEQEKHPNLHLPKIPDVKQELVSKTTEEITNIFGEADEAILGGVMDINPYLYNQLNKKSGGTASTSAKIHDGDVIELDTEPDKTVMQPPPPPEDEYDEQFAISQAVLQGIKSEMAFSDGEEDFLSSNVMGGESLSPSSQVNYDDIIIISESDDDELYDKVADWSNKLLSQKAPDPIKTTQVNPLIEDVGSDQEADSRFGMKKPPRSLLIDSSSEDEDNDVILWNADSTTRSPSHLHPPKTFAREEDYTDDAKLFSRRQRTVSDTDQKNGIPDSTSGSNEISGTHNSSLPKPITPKECQKETLGDKLETSKRLPSARLRNRSKSCYMERPIDIDETFENKDIQENQGKDVGNSCEDLPVTMHAPEEREKTPIKKAKPRTKRKEINSTEEGEEITQEPKENGRRTSPRKKYQNKPTATAAETQAKSQNTRLRNRTRSCYMERPIDLDESLSSKQANEDKQDKQKESRTRKRHKSIEKDCHASKEKQKTPPKNSEGNKSNKTNNSREEIKGKAKETKNNRNSVTPRKEDTVENVTPVKKGVSPRLLNRSKSCFIDQTDNIIKNIKDNSPALNEARGPAIIEAPFMSKNRKQRVIDRQRFVDYQAEINAKWHQKPKDKKKDDQEIKEKRREALKKLSDKPKDEENIPSTSSASKRKYCTSVPTISNTNRGEFLTKEIDRGPPAKIAKNVEKPQQRTPPAKNPIPQRRSTIETDDLENYPQPHCSRPPERKDAQEARNQRTCNRVNFADMERYRQRAEDAKKMEKQRRHVRFRDGEDEIKYIDRVCGANKPVRKSKDTLKICLSTYIERREWTLKGNQVVNDILHHKRTILTWANQWLKHGSVDAVAKTDVLMPIPSDFESLQHYRKTFLPLIKLELLTTIERDYKSSKTTLDLEVTDVQSEKEFYRIFVKTKANPIGKFELYTLSSGSEMAETFASLLEQKTVSGGVSFMTFEIFMQISFEKMKNLKQLTARPVVDSLRVELGALSAIQQLHRSPLSRRILMPTEAVKTVQIPKVSQAFTYTGFTKLDNHQEDICLRVYKRVIDNINPSVTLVQGPPGTGKSILLSNLSLQCLYGKASVMLDRKILICAHSNTAVDHLVKALSNALFAMSHDHFQLVRFGMIEKMSENSRQFSLSEHLRKARNEKLKRLTPENIEMLKKQHSDLSAEIQQLKQNSNIMPTYLQQQLEQKQKQLLLISQQLNPPLTPREEYDISKTCLKRAHIVCTTLSSCVKLANYVDFFDICIIDEATQCTEPWTLLPMRFGIKHLVLVGDTQQLPAVVLSKKAIDFGLGNSMFDRIQKSLVKQLNMDLPGGNQLVHTKLFKLSLQYRMHPEICRWPNKYFYDDQLVSADLTSKPSTLIPYCVVNLSYTRDTGSSSANRSISNDEEARFVGQLLTEMDKHMPSQRYSYGLISPYSSQCYALSQVIPQHMNLTPQTVDSYQGLEKDVVIISNARTRGCGFLANYQRLNVALTRPKRCLVICGNFDDLQSVDLWRQLLDDARQRKVYFDLKRDDVDDLQNSLMKKLLVKFVLNLNS
ncbi:uncharacterized protein [Drosophila kikkawai]|uniref:FHA domain-containing protein n=1 Tax=Drosophila kikkawai TaxID=30033 RepID=A0A6P4I1Q5_DROKI|nr:uncharacterized protein LOC108070572 [Drosophila kikkawai]